MTTDHDKKLAEISRRLARIEKLLEEALPDLAAGERELLKETELIRTKQDLMKEEQQLMELRGEAMERTEESLLRLLGQNTSPPKKHKDILVWKADIWEHCEHKTRQVKDKVFDYSCQLLRAPCRFDPCPLNRA